MDSKELVDTTPIAQLVDSIGAKNVFGEPTSENGVVIIPVAQVEYGFGYGGGYGANSAAEEAVEAAEQALNGEEPSADGGGGGGGGGRATPRGYIRITADEVTYEPISDEERVPLAGIIFAAWLVFWVTLTIRTLIKSVARVKQAQG